MRVLFVAFQNSIHTARWIHQLTDQDWDIHVFPSTLKGEPHQYLESENVKLHYPGSARLCFRMLRRLAHEIGNERINRWFSADIPPLSVWWLTRVIRRIKPDVVHSLEIQHAGYLTLEVRKRLGDKMPAWIVGNWGSDIYLFGRLASHKERIKEVLNNCDYYTCECERDVRLAKQFGLKGKALPVLPNAGGFDLGLLKEFRQSGKTSDRKMILLKGYQGWAGRALVGLRAIELCADELRGFKIVIPLASPEVELAAELLTQKTGLDIDVLHHRSHEDMLQIYGSSRVYIGLSISDAISQSLIEAIVMGTFPIQSSTACADEWIAEGVNGFIVPPEDPQIIANALIRAISDDVLVDNAAIENNRIAVERLDAEYIRSQAIRLYEGVANKPISANEFQARSY